jgi:excisionase family DNA binding protein
MEQPLLLDIESAAQALGVGRSTMYGLMDSGMVRSVHIGRRRLVPREDLEQFVADQRAAVPA